jgi:hypothetical protein
VKSATRRIGSRFVTALQVASLAYWLETAFTQQWVYPDCIYPLFGWPRPYRAYSECCSLEWNIDRSAYAFDLAVYCLIAGALILAARWILGRHKKWLHLPFGVLIASATAAALFQMQVYFPIDFRSLYPVERARPAGLARWGAGYGACPPGPSV